MRNWFRTGGTALVMAALLGGAMPAWAGGTTERVSVGRSGVQGNGGSGSERPSAISADGRFVAFFSTATNLVPGDTNGHEDVFVRDRLLGTTERVSVGPSSVQSNGESFGWLAISGDGRYVAFDSDASNLVLGDTNDLEDVFVHDRRTGTTERVSVGQGAVEGNGGSYGSAISADGRFVAFLSFANNFVPGDTNDTSDVFVRDRRTGTTERVNVGPNGIQGNEYGFSESPSISADGRFVAFVSWASNLVPRDTNEDPDVFVRDRQTRQTERVSVGAGGIQGYGMCYYTSISADGRFVAFESASGNLVPGDTNGLVDVFVRDRLRGTTERVSVGPNGVQSDGDEVSQHPVISPGGRYVGFTSNATSLVPGDHNHTLDVFIRDRVVGVTRRMSGGPSNGPSDYPAISAGGRFVAFASFASNLVPGDTNGDWDVFVRRRW